MYKVTIKTKEGFNEYIVESLKDLEEEFSKPNEGIYVNNMSQYEKTKEELIEERNKCLWHITGTAYWNEKAQELTRRINER